MFDGDDSFPLSPSPVAHDRVGGIEYREYSILLVQRLLQLYYLMTLYSKEHARTTGARKNSRVVDSLARNFRQILPTQLPGLIQERSIGSYHDGLQFVHDFS